MGIVPLAPLPQNRTLSCPPVLLTPTRAATALPHDHESMLEVSATRNSAMSDPIVVPSEEPAQSSATTRHATKMTIIAGTAFTMNAPRDPTTLADNVRPKASNPRQLATSRCRSPHCSHHVLSSDAAADAPVEAGLEDAD